MINKKFSFILMHIGFLLYSFYSVLGKTASLSEQNKYIFYLIIFLILGLYALIWQLVLKVFPLSFAYTNKAIIIIWGMLWGKVFFNEQFTIKKLLAVLLIFTGILILNLSKAKEADDE